uniref:Organic solute carrier partner 1 n=1 Tax=Oncorhynchus kisutch TaxID=8019 RepID=A0A8C7FH31_ONCKI
MFNKTFLEELFKPQELYSKKTLKTVITVTHHHPYDCCSCTQLYDLMTMAFKYQVLLCPRAKDILLDTPSVLSQVDETYRYGEFQLLRQTLLIFFQDMHIRVSIFLKDKVQNSNGRFVLPISGPVPHGTHIPGLIRMFSCNGEEVKRLQVRNGGNYTSVLREGSFEMFGERVIKLGTNMYSVSRPVETHMSGTSKNSAQQKSVTPNPLAKEELNMLARLMGGMDVQKPGNADSGFRVNLFATDEEEDASGVTTDPGSIPGCVAAGHDRETHQAVHNWPSIVWGGFDRPGCPCPIASRLSEQCVKKQCGLVSCYFGGRMALDLRLSQFRIGVAAMGQDCNYQLGVMKLGGKG